MAFYHKSDLTDEDKAKMREGAESAAVSLSEILAHLTPEQLLGARIICDWFKRETENTSPRRLAQIVIKHGNA